MRILFVCDLNSVHSQKWIGYFIEKKHDVFIYSTTPFQDNFLGAKVYSEGLPAKQADASANDWLSKIHKFHFAWFAVPIAEKIFLLSKFLKIRTSVFRHKDAASSILSSVNPDLIHCLRIPNEGFIGMMLQSSAPLVVSTWGNDLTYWARKTLFRNLTERTLKKSSFLFTDCERDVRLSRTYGYSKQKPFLVLPGSGGMLPYDLEIGKRSLESRSDFFKGTLQINARPIFLSLRGFGSQDIDNVPLLKACRLLMKRDVEFRLVIAGKKNGFRYYKLAHLIEKYELGNSISLIEELPHPKALEALQGTDFSISISRNDGTPNSMLEAMTFGGIPVMSDIESIREWVTDGVNGYLFDPRNPHSIADTIQRAIAEKDKHAAMRRRNYNIIAEKADYAKNMSRAEEKLLDFLKKNDLLQSHS
ncbi:MAG: glycosyltransferase [Bacteroidetes bacterium]|nr:glycosyltransferase [Bacteroidota bacterium]MCL5737061.1 glycosyltransferase [Bacteroidota bacterium]